MENQTHSFLSEQKKFIQTLVTAVLVTTGLVFLILWIAALMRSGNELIKISFPPFNHLDAIFLPYRPFSLLYPFWGP